MDKINAKAFGLALGITWGGLIFILGILNMLFFWGNFLLRLMSMVYVGYRPTVLGNIFSSIWAFIYASLFGFVLACIYNKIVDEGCIERQEKIKELAQKIWEKKGRPFGSEKEDWNEAERMVDGK